MYIYSCKYMYMYMYMYIYMYVHAWTAEFPLEGEGGQSTDTLEARADTLNPSVFPDFPPQTCSVPAAAAVVVSSR